MFLFGMLINSNNISFGVNPNSSKLRYSQKDFFVRIQGYGKNVLWANVAKSTADTAANLIRKDTSPENVLKFISAGIAKANKFCLDLYKRVHSGVLRIPRNGWKHEESFWRELITYYGEGRYSHYADRISKTIGEPLVNPYPAVTGMTRTKNDYPVLIHGKPEYINTSLDCVFKLCKRIFPKFIHKDIKQKDMKKLNENIAEIRWILAHSTPWARGSDAISNVFIRAIYKSIGVKSYPLKKGISLDLEAYCTELSEYKKSFSSYFEKEPEIIE